MAGPRARAPMWFTIVAILLVLWGGMGCWAWFQQTRMGADAWGPDITDWDRAFYASLPAWYNVVYAIAVWAGFVAGVCLAIRLNLALPFAVASLVAVVVMFGWTFVATDLIAHKGLIVATGFPVFIAFVAGLQIWLSRLALARGWLQ